MPGNRQDKAIFSESLPVSSIPFLHRMRQILDENNTSTPITLDEEELAKFKANLWIVLNHTFGQLFRIDCGEMYDEIKEVLEEE